MRRVVVLSKRSAGVVVLLALWSAGCTVTYPARVSPLVVSRGADGVEATVGQVALDVELRRADFHTGSRLVVGLVLYNRGSAAVRVDLSRAQLRMRDAYGGEQTAKALATGTGEPPRHLYDGDRVGPVMIEPGGTARAWVAFGEMEVPDELREVVQRVVLVLPAETGIEAREVVLSEPGAPPIWYADAVRGSSGIGMRVLAGPRKVHGGVSLGVDSWLWLDPAWLSMGVDIGMHGWDEAQLPGSLGVHGQLGLPVSRQRTGALSPFLAFEMRTTDYERGAETYYDTIYGPSLGLDWSAMPLQSQHGPFPVSYERAALGSFHFGIGAVWWFGDGLPGYGAPGLIVALSYQVGQ